MRDDKRSRSYQHDIQEQRMHMRDERRAHAHVKLFEDKSVNGCLPARLMHRRQPHRAFSANQRSRPAAAVTNPPSPPSRRDWPGTEGSDQINILLLSTPDPGEHLMLVAQLAASPSGSNITKSKEVLPWYYRHLVLWWLRPVSVMTAL